MMSALFIALFIILACLVLILFAPLRLRHIYVDNTPLADRVKSKLGISLEDLESSLTLKPIVTGDEPYILTYSMPLKLDAASRSYNPHDAAAHMRMLVLWDNDQDAYAYEINHESNGTCIVKWNSIFASYGKHMLQIKLYFPWVGTNRVDGPARTEIVTNILQIESGTESYGSQMWFHCFLHVPSADYKIDIFDSNTNRLKTIIGHTEKGVIDKVWDLKANGQVRQDNEFYSEVYVTPTVTDTNGFIKSNAPTVRVSYP